MTGDHDRKVFVVAAYCTIVATMIAVLGYCLQDSRQSPHPSNGGPPQSSLSQSISVDTTRGPTVTAQVTTITSGPAAGDVRGLGDTVAVSNIRVQLVEIDYRSQDHPDNAAIRYRLRFFNDSSEPIPFKLDRHHTTAVDNRGIKFEDYWSQAENNWGSRCIVAFLTLTFPIVNEFTVAARSSYDFDDYLNPEGAEGSCEHNGEARARVGLETDYVVVKVSGISFRTDQYQELGPALWRLNR